MEGLDQRKHPRWDGMWKGGIKPGQAFDTGSASPALLQEIKSGRVPPGRALVPGCGRGYDVYALAAPDRKALGIELAADAVDAANQLDYAEFTGTPCAAIENVAFMQKNFFDLETARDGDKFSFIYDYTFLCALDPSIRSQWAAKMADLCTPGTGELMTLVFPICDRSEGPPFGVSLQLVEDLLSPYFTKLRLELLPAELCHSGRNGDPNVMGGANSGIGRWRRKGVDGGVTTTEADA